MAKLFQITWLIFFIGISYSWTFPSIFDQDFPSNHIRGSFNNNSSLSSIFNDMNKIMSMMNQRFEKLFDISSNSIDYNNNWLEDRKKLDAIEPICTTTISDNPIQKNRRRKLRNTQTTTCIKELILNGKKQLYKETNITDDKGILIAQSKNYQTISINTNNNTIPIDTNNDKDIISY